ncbi:hypothetical protein PTKIN_Ptkin12aG0130700 [Pterospermum kingtungense]
MHQKNQHSPPPPTSQSELTQPPPPSQSEPTHPQPPASQNHPTQASTTTISKRKSKGKEKVDDSCIRVGSRGRSILEGYGLYTNAKIGVQILDPGMKTQRIISTPKSTDAASASMTASAQPVDDPPPNDFTSYDAENDDFYEQLRDLLLHAKKRRNDVQADINPLLNEV